MKKHRSHGRTAYPLLVLLCVAGAVPLALIVAAPIFGSADAGSPPVTTTVIAKDTHRTFVAAPARGRETIGSDMSAVVVPAVKRAKRAAETQAKPSSSKGERLPAEAYGLPAGVELPDGVELPAGMLPGALDNATPSAGDDVALHGGHTADASGMPGAYDSSLSSSGFPGMPGSTGLSGTGNPMLAGGMGGMGGMGGYGGVGDPLGMGAGMGAPIPSAGGLGAPVGGFGDGLAGVPATDTGFSDFGLDDGVGARRLREEAEEDAERLLRRTQLTPGYGGGVTIQTRRNEQRLSWQIEELARHVDRSRQD